MPVFSANSSITSETRYLVIELETFANSVDSMEEINKAKEDVCRTLLSDPFQDSTAVEIDLSKFTNIPDFLGTLRVAAFRAGFEALEEVHPNSDQFTLSLLGNGSTIVETESGLRMDNYGDGHGNSLENKWHITPKK